jgi:hypothetical protein
MFLSWAVRVLVCYFTLHENTVTIHTYIYPVLCYLLAEKGPSSNVET